MPERSERFTRVLTDQLAGLSIMRLIEVLENKENNDKKDLPSHEDAQKQAREVAQIAAKDLVAAMVNVKGLSLDWWARFSQVEPGNTEIPNTYFEELRSQLHLLLADPKAFEAQEPANQTDKEEA